MEGTSGIILIYIMSIDILIIRHAVAPSPGRVLEVVSAAMGIGAGLFTKGASAAIKG
jgi:hypothetical protein